MGPFIRCGDRRSACAGKRFTYHRSELLAPYGTFLADLPIVAVASTIFVHCQLLRLRFCLLAADARALLFTST
jgi:hypothetical protein